MLSKSLLAVAFAGAATAVTPTGFQPVSNADLIVAFGNTLALNGKAMTKAETAQVPTIGTTQRLMGTYTVMMVDPDIPPQTAGGPTGELLHWMQQGLTSATTATMIGGMMVFVLSSASNETAFAPYFGPSPPNRAPNTHRYTQLLLDTSGTNNSAAIAQLKQAAATRTNFNAVNVVKAANVPILAGNSFNVSNGTSTSTNGTSTSGSSGTIPAAAPINSATLVAANITKVTPSAQQPGGAAATGSVPSSNGTGTPTNGTSPTPGTSGFGQSGGGAYVAGLIALAAALFLL
ncbi:phosphatidylethanolamine-binding protein [Cadophora sp. MPI-SDFR-AT-0126]|nr:phosphatidylethanolamine-binding protein [Leotiomycetes sp. MPI-SDFR-AT-0126]